MRTGHFWEKLQTKRTEAEKTLHEQRKSIRTLTQHEHKDTKYTLTITAHGVSAVSGIGALSLMLAPCICWFCIPGACVCTWVLCGDGVSNSEPNPTLVRSYQQTTKKKQNMKQVLTCMLLCEPMGLGYPLVLYR